MHIAKETLFKELLPKMTARTASDVQEDLDSWRQLLRARDLELVEFNSQDKLEWYVSPRLEGFSVHTEDEYTVALDSELKVAAIAVHNKGSLAGRVMIILVWRGEEKYYSMR